MRRYAIFVDAGYLFASGATALTGINQPRSHIELDQSTLVAMLKATASAKVNGASLLRIYWYDGLLSEGITRQQQNLAAADDVKLRLGVVNAYGQQKGVDSLIVTDLVELARNRAISDAVVLSGDEDVRIGVQIAQSFGLRVHLIGIEPQKNQSRTLAHESDTTTEWSVADVGSFMSNAREPDLSSRASIETTPTGIRDDVKLPLDEVVARYLQSLDTDAVELLSRLSGSASIPRWLDAPLMAWAANAIDGGELNRDERHYLRARFKLAARTAADSLPD